METPRHPFEVRGRFHESAGISGRLDGSGQPTHWRIGSDPLLDIGFQQAVNAFVLLDGLVQSEQEALGRIEIHHQPVRQLDRLRRDRGHLGVQAKIQH